MDINIKYTEINASKEMNAMTRRDIQIAFGSYAGFRFVDISDISIWRLLVEIVMAKKLSKIALKNIQS